MNKLPIFLLGLTLTLSSISCKKETDVIDPTPDIPTPTVPATGAITPVGTPEGTAITALIGPGGGIIESADKRIQITIPAGALTTDQSISVQPIQNNCPAGTGQAFRLTPHGLTFAKPATITFQYNEQDVNGSAPEALRVAYQGTKGFWQSPSVKSVDTTAKTVSVQTTHFSDWGLFQTMSIDPRGAFLNPGEHIHLSVRQTIPQSSSASDDDLFVPIPALIDAKYIDKWTLQGEGVLTHQQNNGDYYAPAKIPATNPTAVTVFLNQSVTIDGKVFRDIRLVANMFVAPEGISLQIDGGDWQTYAGGATINSQENVILGKNGTEIVSVGWTGQPTGIYHWTLGVDVTFHLSKGKLLYQNRFGIPVSVSGGSLRVNNDDSDWVVGSFTVAPAGWTNAGTQPISLGTAAIKGVFRVKRVN